jgi:hypothetical protein
MHAAFSSVNTGLNVNQLAKELFGLFKILYRQVYEYLCAHAFTVASSLKEIAPQGEAEG